MKTKQTKFWAYFESTASYELMTHAQYLKWENGGQGHDYRINLEPFETLKDAKNYLLTHFNGEIADARRNINDIREWTAKENK